MKKFIKNISIIFICHDIALVRSIANRIIVMHKGDIVEVLTKDKIRKTDLQPYTRELFNSIFTLDM